MDNQLGMYFTYTRKLITEIVRILTHFLFKDQFIGFSGSRFSGSSHQTMSSAPGSGCAAPPFVSLEFDNVGVSASCRWIGLARNSSEHNSGLDEGDILQLAILTYETSTLLSLIPRRMCNRRSLFTINESHAGMMGQVHESRGERIESLSA